MANMVFIFPPGEVNPEIQDMIALPLATAYPADTWAYSILVDNWYHGNGLDWICWGSSPPGEIELAMMLLK